MSCCLNVQRFSPCGWGVTDQGASTPAQVYYQAHAFQAPQASRYLVYASSKSLKRPIFEGTRLNGCPAGGLKKGRDGPTKTSYHARTMMVLAWLQASAMDHMLTHILKGHNCVVTVIKLRIHFDAGAQ